MDPGQTVVLSEPTYRIQQLNNQASSVQINTSIQAKMYFRSSLEMLRMAKVYSSEGSYENSFVLYQKYLSLIVEKLPKHPGYKEVDASFKKAAKQKCAEAFTAAENIKEKLKKRYEVEYKEAIAAEKKRLEALEIEEERKRLEHEAKLAEEQSKQAEEQKRRQQAAAEEQDRKYAMYMQQQLEKKAENVDQSSHGNLPRNMTPGAVSVLPPPPQYTPRLREPVDQLKPQPAYAPVSIPTAPPVTDLNTVPSVNRALKPVHFTQTASEISANRFGLRKVGVPSNLAARFEQLTKVNTNKNIETCGLLCGKLKQGSFFISHVVIPKQQGTPDSCTTLNEEEIFEFQDQNELITLGWVHTHPTQTAFLSSVDLHTHASYQLMMPEAIAIVVSCKFKETGIYQLTPQYGLDYIAKCTKVGFHPHPKEPPLFQDCEHVQLDSSYDVIITDLR